MKTIIVSLFIFLLGACDSSAVDVEKEVGKAGMFCATAADCALGLKCLEHYCCRNEKCAATCQSLIEKESDLSQNMGARHPNQTHDFRRRCHRLCCQGESVLELRRAISAPSGAVLERYMEIDIP